MKLLPEVKTAWLAALRSGEYKQTDGQLKIANRDGTFSHCCLGVLCEIIDASAWTTDKPSSVIRHNGAGSFPKRSVLEAAGMPGTSEGVPLEGEDHPFWSLADMNDIGKTFAEIADEIEARL